ncbi:unnamed protein product (macronuclear) [Paramecium tetraurelia]|uniref:Anti-silencing factor n=1 Tax=Paramecium tetraurelia TaxID=5888 RepID=A0CNU4_PARTE|nr:uncharacterized protein GSPATT00008903001 [Paramecium tetraurelia]CAK72461.1 unnamed protein product [Paramecium tetraurelia]|eukprot:XP_001439858.1 hypothetical protein (macronuclear) [Paramecium tetraurelia strain d4-2]
MALVEVTNIIFENELALFQTPISLQITFEVLNSLPDEIEWNLIYIGSPLSDKYDQVLDNFSMGPLQKGLMQFTITSQPPNYQLIPSKEDLFSVSALILTAKYRQKEFFRVGYYVYNNYTEAELIENEPQVVLIDRVYRQILGSNPRITKFPIDWEGQLTQLYVPPSNQQFMFESLMSQQQSGVGMQTEKNDLVQQGSQSSIFTQNLF